MIWYVLYLYYNNIKLKISLVWTTPEQREAVTSGVRTTYWLTHSRIGFQTTRIVLWSASCLSISRVFFVLFCAAKPLGQESFQRSISQRSVSLIQFVHQYSIHTQYINNTCLVCTSCNVFFLEPYREGESVDVSRHAAIPLALLILLTVVVLLYCNVMVCIIDCNYRESVRTFGRLPSHYYR